MKKVICNIGFIFLIDSICLTNMIANAVMIYTKESVPVICFDLDNTLIAKNKTWKRDLLIIWQALPWHFDGLWALKTEQAEDKYGTLRFKAVIENHLQLAPSGGAISLAFYGIHGKNGKKLQTIIPAILDIDCDYTMLLPGASILLDYIKNKKNYHIIYASNKDYVTYKITAKKIEIAHNFLFNSCPTFVLLAQPTKEYLDTMLPIDSSMPDAFKKLVEQIKDAQKDDKIFFVPEPEKKPENLYYTILKEKIKVIIPDHGKILFFDDKKYNVEAAIRNGISASYHVKKGTEIADIIKNLEAEGLLSPETDASLYKALAKEGVMVTPV